MNLQKKIEVNQSSLLGLKAELLRKKSEVSTAKYSQELDPPKVRKKKLTTKLDKSNKGVNERDHRDAEEIQEETDELKKSQKILEAKAKLYEDLVSGSGRLSDTSTDTSGFLVDFKQKCQEEVSQTISSEDVAKSNDSDDYGEYSDEDEWVDFVDCLGRTKRCHRDDLTFVKEQDEKLKKSLHGDGGGKENEPDKQGTGEMQLPQLCSEDMKKEIMRQKWEEQERNLLDKKNVHYQDILFDEARTHGVGYYEFSTDERERAKQQEDLKNLRKQTEEQQAATQAAAKKKQKLMEERLKAARRRKRERLGLPPAEEEETEEVKEEEKKPEPPEELRRDVRKPAAVRPWDIGKDSSPKVMSQEEWVEKKRAERIEEFAPPMQRETRAKVQRKRQYHEYNAGKSFGGDGMPTAIQDELEEVEEWTGRGRGVEIAPPPTFDLYGPSSRPQRTQRTGINQAAMDKSIEEGLNFLRKQVEEKQKRKRREDDFEII